MVLVAEQAMMSCACNGKLRATISNLSSAQPLG
jgi:hypothetical protein